eukprot:g33119.t1
MDGALAVRKDGQNGSISHFRNPASLTRMRVAGSGGSGAKNAKGGRSAWAGRPRQNRPRNAAQNDLDDEMARSLARSMELTSRKKTFKMDAKTRQAVMISPTRTVSRQPKRPLSESKRPLSDSKRGVISESKRSLNTSFDRKSEGKAKIQQTIRAKAAPTLDVEPSQGEIERCLQLISRKGPSTMRPAVRVVKKQLPAQLPVKKASGQVKMAFVQSWRPESKKASEKKQGGKRVMHGSMMHESLLR